MRCSRGAYYVLCKDLVADTICREVRPLVVAIYTVGKRLKTGLNSGEIGEISG